MAGEFVSTVRGRVRLPAHDIDHPLDLFHRNVREVPDASAIDAADGTWTYRELHREAVAFAVRLESLGARAGDAVAIALPRSGVSVVAHVAIAELGAIVVPVALDDPADRTDHILASSGAVFVVSDHELSDRLPWAAPIGRHSADDVDGPEVVRRPVDHDRFCILFTSGSTGTPKGVEATTAGMLNQVVWSLDHFAIGRADRLLLKAPSTFDAALWELWTALSAGALLVVLADGEHRDGAAILERVRAARVTVCHLVPTMLRQMLEHSSAFPETLRVVLIGGEALPGALLDDFRRACNAPLVNMYGPTEASVQVSWWVADAARGAILIGNPIDNCVLTVLDDDLRPVPIGGEGQLAIGGVPLAAGYLDDPGRTAAAFTDVAGLGRMYLTGDLARRHEDGFEHLGRLDGQVKVGGNRVETAALEAFARDIPGVRDVAVVPVAAVDGIELVCALVCPESSLAPLRDGLLATFPAAHIPSRYRRYEALPLSPSGKVDRRRLAGDSAEDVADVPVRNLTDAWRSVLGSDDDHVRFLDAGGSSLIAVRLASLVRRHLDADFRPSQLLATNPTLRDLAEMVTHRETATELDSGARPAMGPGPAHRSVRATPAQKQLYTHLRAFGGDPAYAVVGRYDVDGILDVDRLRLAWEQLHDDVDVLRATFHVDGSDVVIRTSPPAPSMRWVSTDGADWDKTCEAVAWEEARRPFPPQESGRARLVVLVDLAAGRSALLLIADHLISDQRSLELMVAELDARYSSTPAPRPPQFLEHARSLTGSETSRAETAAMIAQRVTEATAGPLAFQESTTAVTSEGTTTSAAVSAALQAAVSALASQRGVSTAMVYLAAFGRVLSDWTDGNDIVVGVPVSRRDHVEADRTIGFFMQTVPVALQPRRTASDTAFIHHTRDRFLEAFDRSEATIGDVIAALRDRGHNEPPIRFWFNDVSAGSELTSFAGHALRDRPVPSRYSLFDVGLYVVREGTEERLELTARRSVWPRPATGEAFLQALLEELDSLVVGKRAAVSAASFERIEADPPGSFVEALTRAAHRDPERPAVTGELMSFTRQQLLAEVIATTERLREQPDGPLMVLPERSGLFPVALLAGWSAGRTVALVDPESTTARVAAIREQVGESTVVRIMGSGLEITAGEPGAADSPPSHILFTSGTTGVPKLVRHALPSLVEAIDWYIQEFDCTESDRFVLASPLGHDPVLRDVLGAIASGAELLVPTQADVDDATRFVEFLRTRGVTVLHVAPARARTMVGIMTPLPDLRLIVLHGATLDAATARMLAERAPNARIVTVYGLTETTQITAWGEVDTGPSGAEPSLHAVVPHRRLVVRGERGDDIIGAVGELLVSGTGVVDIQIDGWLHTGDLARRGAAGAVHILGRRDQRVSVHGNRVDSLGVETTLRRLRGVRDAAVVQMLPDGPLFAVIAADSMPDDSDQAAVLGALVPWERPIAVVHVDALPLSRNGKVDPDALRSLVAGPRLGETPGPRRPAGAPDAERLVAEAVRSALRTRGIPAPDFDRDTPFEQVGLSSFELLLVADTLSAQHAVDIPAFELFQHRNVASIAASISGAGRPVHADARDSGAPDRAPAGSGALTEREKRRAARRRRTGNREA